MKVTLVRSLIGTSPKQKANAVSLGLKRPGNTITIAENAANLGKIKIITHLVKVEK